MFGWLEKINIREPVYELWRQFRGQIPPEVFAVEVAAHQGWTLRIVGELLIEFEERWTEPAPESESLTYAPGGGLPLLKSVDIVAELAGLSSHLLLATRTGAGKSTLLKAVVAKILETRKGAEFVILDPKTTDWLGLQRLSGVVTYLPSGESESVELAEAAVLRVFETLGRRKEQQQKALMAGVTGPKFHPLFLIVDEWFSLYDRLKRLKRPATQGWLNEIVAQGRELDCHVVLVSQSHNVEEIGFSRSMRRSFEFCCLGATAASFEPLIAAVNDANLFASRADRDRLGEELQQAIAMAGGSRVCLSTLGTPKIAILPNLSWAHKVSVAGAGGAAGGAITDSPLPQLQPAPEEGFAPKEGLVPSVSGDAVPVDLDGFRPLYRAVTKLLECGVSETVVVKEVFGCANGRTFSSKGKPALQALLRLGKLEGWDK
ncbi:FtsK/SpoIIIE domain-containing protein [Kamptonema formosum]|uniref:FtsK/SpoIIIE domain-containing protein n=1 Tax=Kamptonema formosum TaxID=331992 RepID=UPI00034563FB|nr:FtsK/SpoIIIE domain-containing protein [Oscillatoria sp. PCC 10802]